MENIQQTESPMMYREKEYKCPIDVTLAVVGGKWKASILNQSGKQFLNRTLLTGNEYCKFITPDL